MGGGGIGERSEPSGRLARFARSSFFRCFTRFFSFTPLQSLVSGFLILLSKRFRAQMERLEWGEGGSAWYTGRHLTKVATKAFWLLIIKYYKIKLPIILALCVCFSKQLFCCGPSTVIVTPYSLPLCWTTFPRKNLFNTLSNLYTGICFLVTQKDSV